MLDAGEPDQVLASRADTDDLCLGVAHVGSDEFGSLVRILAPHRRGLAHFHPVVINPQIDRLLRLSTDHDVLVAGELQLTPKETSEAGAPPEAGLRRLGRPPRGSSG